MEKSAMLGAAKRAILLHLAESLDQSFNEETILRVLEGRRGAAVDVKISMRFDQTKKRLKPYPAYKDELRRVIQRWR